MPYRAVGHLILALSIMTAISGDETSAQSVEFSVGKSREQSAGQAWVEITLRTDVELGAGQFDLVFVSERLEFKEVEAGERLPSALLESNLVEPNRLRMAFVSSEPVSGEGELLVVKFTILGTEASPFTFGLQKATGWQSVDSARITAETRDADIRSFALQTGNRREAGALSDSLPPRDPVVPTSIELLPGWAYFVGGAGAMLIVVLMLMVLRGTRHSSGGG